MDHGIVTFGGVEITLTQEAYADNHGSSVAYYAEGEDQAGNVYKVRWCTTDAWDEAQQAAKEGLGEWPDDESGACDWDNPVDAVLIESAE